MSVFETSFLVIDLWLPKISYGSDCITARTCFLLQAVSLFSSVKKVHVSASTKSVTISTRKWWIKNTVERIPHTSIRYVDTSELTVGESPGYTPDGLGWRDQQENFIPFLMTTGGRKIELLSFYGAGSVHTGWWGVLLGDSIIDFKGRQEKRAQEFSERIASMLGIPYGIDSKMLADSRSSNNKIKCTGCGHFNSESYTRCLYCGADIVRD